MKSRMTKMEKNTQRRKEQLNDELVWHVKTQWEKDANYNVRIH